MRRLEADTDLKARGAPVDELDCALGLQGGESAVDIIGNHITAVKQACRHVLAGPRVTLYHLVAWFEAGHGNLRDSVGLVAGFGRCS